MGNLGDQLKKANLLSKKDAKRIAHEQRVERKEKGREQLEKEQKDRQAEIQAKRDADRDASRERELALERERQASAEVTACQELLKQAHAPSGRASWFFELPDGRLPSLRLSETDRHQLQGGHLCVVRNGPEESLRFGLLATEHAKRIERSLPELVLWGAPGVLQAS